MMCVRVFPYAYGIVKEAFDDMIPSVRIRRKGRNKARKALPGFCFAHVVPGYEIEGGAKPGGEKFQLRVYANGDELSTLGERGVNVSNWGKSPGGDALADTRDYLSRISFAQAEYYHQGSILEAQATWSMKWRARLRRFTRKGSPSRDCIRAGGDPIVCARLREVFGRMGWAIVH